MMEAGGPKDIFVADGMHMSPAGYAIWTARVGPVVRLNTQREARACARRG